MEEITKEFKSITEEVKYHIRQLISDGSEHTRNELLSHVRANVVNVNAVSENLFTGAVKGLMMNGQLGTVKRGVYKQTENNIDYMSLNEKVLIILGSCKDRLNHACCINVLQVSDKELQVAKQIKEFIGYIDIEMKKYEKKEVVTQNAKA